MGNIQDVQEYQRVPIFPRSRSKSRTPRRIAPSNNSPYHRQMSKSVYSHPSINQLHTSKAKDNNSRKTAISSVIKHGNPYQSKKYFGGGSAFKVQNQEYYRGQSLKRQLSFDANSWENSNIETRCTPKSCYQQLLLKKINSPPAFHYPQKTSSQIPNFCSSKSPWKQKKVLKLEKNEQIGKGLNTSLEGVCQKCHGMKNVMINEEEEIKTQRKSYKRPQVNIQAPKDTYEQKRQTSYPHLQRSSNNPEHKPLQSSIISENPSQFYAENRGKCEEIIKKVRNFNDFLNEVKRKLKNNVESGSQSVHFHSSMDPDSSRSMVMSIKLESEKIQLEKYKNLVNRQLSKQHSIESIQIQNGNNQYQKLIKINYDSVGKIPSKQSVLSEKKFEKTNNCQQKGIVQPQNGKNKTKFTGFSKVKGVEPSSVGTIQQIENINDQRSRKSKQKQKIHSRIRVKYEEAAKKVRELGTILDEEDDRLCKRMNNISNLMGHLEGVSMVQEKSCKELSQFLQQTKEIIQYPNSHFEDESSEEC